MRQRRAKDLAGAVCEFPILKAERQFIIDEAALVVIGRADVHYVVDNDQFRMQNLRLILIDFDARRQEPPIEALSGKL